MKNIPHIKPYAERGMALSEGQIVGPYTILAQIGFGGMATVYKAYHARLDRHIAIKMMHAAFQEDQNFLARFEREAQIVARLEHPHIIPVYDFADLERQPYLVMKFVEGRTLKAALYQGALPLAEITRVMTALADALDYAHRQSVLHRDIKPSNIILANDGTPYLTDFGLARMAQLGDSTLSSDMLLGTPHYISPEQAMGSRDLTTRTDLYSLAVVLYELLVGRVPFMSDTPFAVIHSHIYSPLPKPSAINPEIPPAVENVLIKALAKNPADRYQTAGEMIAAFKAAVAESGMPELDPNRIHTATQNLANLPPEYERPSVESPLHRADPNTGVIRSRLSAPASIPIDDPASDPEMTTAPTPLPRADHDVVTDDVGAAYMPPAANQDTPTAQKSADQAKPKQYLDPDALGASAGRMLGETAANIAVNAARFANSAINETAKSLKDTNVRVKIGDGSAEDQKRKRGAVEINNWDDAKRLWRDFKDSGFDIHTFTENAYVDLEDDEAIRQRIKKQRDERAGFAVHAVIYLAVIGTLVAASLPEALNQGEFFWAAIPALAWGSGLLAHGVETFYKTGERERSRIRAVNNAYYREYGDAWDQASKKDLKKIRSHVLARFNKRKEFFEHLGIFVMINTMLVFINLSSSGTFPWALIPLAGWGIGLVAHFFETFGNERYDASLDRAVERERMLLANEKFKNEARNSSYKRKNDEDYDEQPEVRLTEDGEFTDSMLQEIEPPSPKSRRRK